MDKRLKNPAVVIILILLMQTTAWASLEAESWVDRGLAISQSKPDSDEEAACYRQALEIDPDFASAHFNLAFVLDSQARQNWRGPDTTWEMVGRLHEAAEHYALAASLDPGRENAYVNLAAAVEILLTSPTKHPPELHRLLESLIIAREAAPAAKSADYVREVDRGIEQIEDRLARLKDIQPKDQLVEADYIVKRLSRSFTRGQSPYQGPRVPLMIHFDTGKATIRQDSAAQLQELAKALENPGLNNAAILIEGHTDSRGETKPNQTLSEKRAASVKAYLVERLNLPPDRLQTKGYGETRPIRPNESEEDLAKNRRVEFVNLEALGIFENQIQARNRSGEIDVYDVLY